MALITIYNKEVNYLRNFVTALGAVIISLLFFYIAAHFAQSWTHFLLFNRHHPIVVALATLILALASYIRLRRTSKSRPAITE
jgi:membrane protein DedA with SNARE-associated domain